MVDAFDIAQQIRRDAPSILSGSLTFWGEWFGRPNDNVHKILGCLSFSEEDLVVLLFDGGERLWLWGAEGVVANAQAFVVQAASQVRWEWYWYGAVPRPDALQFREYERYRGELTIRGSDIQTRTVQLPAAPAVEIHGPPV